MSQRDNRGAHLSRRRWMVLAASALSGCGGGSAGDTAGLPGTGGTGNVAGLPGTGGTGIYAQGSISGFGSVIVNGVTYDNSTADMLLDDVRVSQDRLRLGMMATVQGERGADATLGTASRIEVWSIAQGVVTDVSADQFKVAGMSILTNSATWFYGFSAEARPTNGSYVSVWGLQAGEERHWTATCVEVSTQVADAVSSGFVKLEDSQPYLNGLRLTGLAADKRVDRALVRVQGAWSADGGLKVVSAKLLGTAVGALPKDEVEIEGLVTTTPSASGFMLGSIKVDTSSPSYSPPTAPIILGARVEVYGSWQQGVLKATKVELEDAQTASKVEIKARIEQFTSLANFMVQGQRCDATGVTISQSTEDALKNKPIVKVKGTKAGDVLRVSELEIVIED